MIKSLTIKNHESHKDTCLEFSPTTNVIIGENDTGKSSILRALKLVVENTAGTFYIPTYDPKAITECILETSEGDIVTRQRGSKNINNYLLNEEILKGFGQTVPEEIQKVLNITNINIQSQKEPDFLLSNTSGQIASYLNQIVNLNIIDTTLAKIEKRKRTANTSLTIKEKDLEEQEENLLKYANLDNLEIQIKSLEQLFTIYTEKSTRLHSARTNLYERNKLFELILKFEETIKYENQINTLIKLNSDIQKTEEILNKVKNLNQERNLTILYLKDSSKKTQYEEKINQLIELNRKRKEDYNKLIDIAKKYNFREELLKEINKTEKVLKYEKTIKDLLFQTEEGKKLQTKFNNLKNLFELRKDTLQDISSLNILLKEAEKEYQELMPDICPLCGNKIKKT